MNDIPFFPHLKDGNLKQAIAREGYFRLREQLVALQSAPEPDAVAIDGVIRALEKAQLAYKATHGLFGNNPIDDAEESELRAPPVAPDEGPLSPFIPDDPLQDPSGSRALQAHRADHRVEQAR